MNNTTKKMGAVSDFKISPNDTGSESVQIALFQARVIHLTEHVKTHPKDFAARKQLLILVARIQTKLRYLAKHNPEQHAKLVKELKIRVKKNK